MPDEFNLYNNIQVIGDAITTPYPYTNEVNSWNIKTHPTALLNVNPELQDKLLIQIRSDHTRRYQPVFCVNQSKLSEILSDGDLTQMAQKIPTIIDRLALRHETPHPDILEIIAWYCWSRGNFRLKPVWSPEHRTGYSYPLLDCLNNGESSQALLRAIEHNILVPAKLVDRIRLCSSCSSVRINYIDVCPKCSDINIQLSPGVHCFVCGYVNEQEVFSATGIMQCPNCTTKLRHIGVDYDRPLERYRCRSCQARFVEAAVKVRCHDCNKSQSSDDLAIAHIHELEVGKHARQISIEGFHDSTRPLLWQSPVSKSHLPWLLRWVSANQRRYGGDNTLMAVWLSNLSQITLLLGKTKSQERINELTRRLQAIFRDTDVICRYANDLLIFILPHTNTNVSQIIFNKITHMNAIEGLDQLKLVIEFNRLPIPDSEKVEDWLARWIEEVTHHG
ncbi:diguanylate cyclase (plasmid) [Photobacterium sp. DA100]|uniref:TackOD1 domain-containing metal-binding protein n=1 Tax=Photobacterium sp. DA100 TaxID=3027472 RepID=UPI002479839F|nr:diguanylate cyclase [Photobacterium sp. DA100]WEM45364.1 diguanylate cyclase [Photobacterium sp. DA100]